MNKRIISGSPKSLNENLINKLFIIAIIFVLVVTSLGAAYPLDFQKIQTLENQNRDIIWDVTINFTEPSGSYEYTVFGEAPDANDGPPADSYDMPKPPAPMPPYIRSWFNDNLPIPYDILWMDYRHYPDNTKTWNLSVQWIPSDYQSPTTITMTWSPTEINMTEYTIITLCTDEGTPLKNMLLNNSYSFTCQAVIPQNFKIICVANQPPNVPMNPSPANGSSSVLVNADLEWTCSDPDGDALTYDVYFGTSSVPPKVASNISLPAYDPGTMDYGTMYYWKIIAWDIYDFSTTGPTWHFLTNNLPNQPSNPFPSNGSTGVSIDVDLSWTGGDPDPGDVVTYDVYFGLSSPPPLVEENQSGLSYDPGMLEYDIVYYWRIISWDSFGGGTSSPIWSFTTRTTGPSGPGDTNQTNLPPVADASLSDQAGFVGTKLLFNGNQSYDSDGYITRWFWDFGDGTNGSGEITTHTYQSLGVYTVVLTVTDEKGATGNDSIIVEIGIANHPPTTPVITGTRIGERDILYTYTVSSTDPDNDFLQYTISWGDGTFDRSEFLPNGTVYFFSYSWSAAGKFHVTITATDNMTVSEIAPFDVFIDVFFVRSLGFLYDTNNDELYDSFYSNATGMITSAQRLENGSYLLDTDSDGKWNYLFDPTTGSLTSVGTGVTTIENQWVFIGIIAVAVCCIAGIVYLYKKRYF